jgi:transposase
MAKLDRRRFNREFKIQVCQEIEAGVRSRAQVCREYQLTSTTVGGWLASYRKDPENCFPASPTVSGNGADSQQAKINQLEAALGRLVMENELLRKALGSLKKRKEEEEN